MMEKWPVIDYAEAKASYDTLHMWTQILGKIKLKTLPWKNHSWHVALHFTPTGLTTGNLPYKNFNFQLDLDLTGHRLLINTSFGDHRELRIEGLSVAKFYKKLFQQLEEVGIHIKIYTTPVEVADPIPFEEDDKHNTYRPQHIEKLQRVILSVNEVLNDYRCEFKGKGSEVNFFWGSFDMAVSRFSGRKAPKHPGGVPNLANWVVEEAYSHEVLSAGFWPGSEMLPEAAFYCYHYPEPQGFKEASILPKKAFYHDKLGEFILPYNVVQQSADPGRMLKEFLNSTYKAGAELAGWDRNALEN